MRTEREEMEGGTGAGKNERWGRANKRRKTERREERKHKRRRKKESVKEIVVLTIKIRPKV